MESSLVEINGFYKFPLYQTATLKWSYHCSFCFLIIIFLGFILIPGKDHVKIILNVFFLLFAVLFGYAWLAVGFLKKTYLNINDEYLEYKWLFGHKIIPLSSIYEVEFFSERGIINMGVWANDQGKKSFWENTDRFFGRDYSIRIVISMFPKIDFEKLRKTLLSKSLESEKLN